MIVKLRQKIEDVSGERATSVKDSEGADDGGISRRRCDAECGEVHLLPLQERYGRVRLWTCLLAFSLLEQLYPAAWFLVPPSQPPASLGL